MRLLGRIAQRWCEGVSVILAIILNAVKDLSSDVLSQNGDPSLPLRMTGNGEVWGRNYRRLASMLPPSTVTVQAVVLVALAR
jgi:hypothetical protein